MCGFCNVWVCVCVGVYRCGFGMCGCFVNCVGVLVICVLVFTTFCIVCPVFLLFLLCIFILICY